MTLYAFGNSKPYCADPQSTFIAPTADVIGDVRLGAEVSLWFKAVLRGDNDPITIGDRSNIQDASIIHTDHGAPVIVGMGVTVGHMVMLHGCVIGDHSLIGMGSVILNHARIGKNCLVGARSLVTEGKDFPDGVLIMGSPAKVVRELTEAELSLIEASAVHYVQKAQLYQHQLVRLEPI